MIRLEKVNKYFNRHKRNEIHVINNTTLTMPSSGLVAFLGPSGCGKTTLLNVIGGLDKINSGKIYVDGIKITKRSVKKIDEIRNLNIGYIFQDYKLVDNMTVFDNVALSLKIIGLKDKEEIKKRVMYALEKVGMSRYKNRPSNMLSGGERQRVGIARAIVKNPKIIIADEPTGNLDSKNSLEVMNIIKSIAKKYLVILVTHEEELAKFFANRIIEIRDGIVINDYENNNNSSLDYKIENEIYLKDYEDITNISKDNIKINIYKDKEEELNLDVVFKNGNIYIKTDAQERLEVIDNNSHIELINDHYKGIENKDISFDYDIEKISNLKFKPKYSSIFKLASFISYGFKKVFNYPLLKKLLLIGFFLSGMFIFYATSSIMATLDLKEEEFITVNKDYLTLSMHNIKLDDYNTYENLAKIDYLIPGDSIINLEFKFDNYLQTMGMSRNLSASLSDIANFNPKDLKYGRMPNNDYEVILDELVLNNFLKSEEVKMAGFLSIEEFLNRKLYLDNMEPFTIVGISNLSEPVIFAPKNLFINMVSNSKIFNTSAFNISRESIYNNLADYTLLSNKIKLIKGRMPNNDYEIIINSREEEILPLDKEIDLSINNHKLKVVGYYESISETEIDNYLTNSNTIKYYLINNVSNITIYTLNKEEVIKYFKDQKLNIKDSYDYAKDNYLKDQKDSIIKTLTVSGVILAISLVEILLMIRSSFLSRIKEVGIYRAIGIKKSDIYKMFAGEILAITLIASILGISFMSYILYNLVKVDFIKDLYLVNIQVYLLSIILITIFNLLVGLIPVYNTIKKTPAQILARADVD